MSPQFAAEDFLFPIPVRTNLTLAAVRQKRPIGGREPAFLFSRKANKRTGNLGYFLSVLLNLKHR